MKSWMKWALGLVGGTVAAGTAYMLAPTASGAHTLAAGSVVTLKPFGGSQFQIVGRGTDMKTGQAANNYSAVDLAGKLPPRAFGPAHIFAVVRRTPGVALLT